jgi:adenylate cyclase
MAHNARVVKTIGDAVMFVASSPLDACRVALDIVDDVDHHPVLTRARGAVAFGDLLGRDGDFFGPIVNLAARATKVAEPGQVITTSATPAESGLALHSIGAHPLRGVAAPTDLFVVSR